MGVFVFFGVLDITQRLGWIQWSSFWAVIFSILSFSSAVLVMIYLGFLMASARAIPLWRSPMTPAVFLSYSLTLGAAGAAILNPAMDAPAKAQLAPILLFMAGNYFLADLYSIDGPEICRPGSGANLEPADTGTAEKHFPGRRSWCSGCCFPVFLAGYAVMAQSHSGFILFFIGVLVLGGGFLYEKVILDAGIYSPLLEITK